MSKTETDMQRHAYSATIRYVKPPSEVSEPIELDLTERAYIYRLWDSEGRCLYVGKASGIHPSRRVRDHNREEWWGDVARADYVEVYDTSRVFPTELSFIRKLNPVHNRNGKSDYDWESWFDGSIWHLERGVHFDVDPEKFRSTMNNYAYRYGFVLQTKVMGDTFILVASERE